MMFHSPADRTSSTFSGPAILLASVMGLSMQGLAHATESISITEFTCTTTVYGGLTPLRTTSTQHANPTAGDLYASSATYSGSEGDAETYGAGKYVATTGKRSFNAWMQSSDSSPNQDYFLSEFVFEIKGSFASFAGDITFAASSFPGDVSPMSYGNWKAEYKIGSGGWNNLGNDASASVTGVGGESFHYRFTVDGSNDVGSPGSQLPELPNMLGWVSRSGLGDPVPGPSGLAAIGGLIVLGRRRRR